MRRIACFMLSLLIITGVPVSACAAQSPGGIETQSLYSAKPTVTFIIAGDGNSSVTLRCPGKSDVTKIKAKTCIEKKSGTRWVKVNVGTSDNYIYHSVNSSKLMTSFTKQLTGSGSYRCTTTFTLYAKTTETITITNYAEY